MKGMDAQVYAKNVAQQVSSSKAVKSVVTQVMYFFAGVLVSKGAIFGSYAPFGASAVAAVPFKNLLATALGTIFGYILLTPSGCFRYIATVIAVAAIRWTLCDIKKLNKSKLFAPLVAFIPMLATGIVLVAVGGFDAELFAMCVIEALLSGVGAYFFYRTIILAAGTRSITTLNQQEIACMAMTGCIMLLSFAGITVASISLGRVAAVLIIMLCARYGAVAGGCISGVATGVIFSMTDSTFAFIAGAYAFGGLMAGLFAPAGKLACGVAFLLCNAVMSFQSGNTDLILVSVYETIIAGTVFMLLPKDLGNRISAIFAPPTDLTRTEGLRRSVIMRLDFASRALKDVSGAVDSVAEKMKDLYSTDISWVYGKATDETCSHCGLRVYCWEKQRHTSLSDFDRLTAKLKKEGRIEDKDFSMVFAKKCCKPREMAMSINKHYEAYTAFLCAERRVGEVRAVVAGQFSGLGEILGEMAEEFEQFEKFDMMSAERVSSALKMAGFVPLDVCCRLDRLGRMTVEIETTDTDRNLIKKSQLLKEISKACLRKMDTPSITMAPNRCRIQMCELPLYDTEIGSAQHVSGNGQLCGDSYNYFADGMGKIVAIISDGMGTGGRAAVDGSMAESIMTKLIKAGLGYDCALRVVNSALMVKSGDESLATIDIVAVDLFTGMAEVIKAGAPLTFIKKGDKVYRSDSASLPAGILPEIKFSHASYQLNNGDIVVMISDGATATGDSWIEDTILNWKTDSMTDLSKEIVAESKERRSDGYDDDITVVAIRLLG